MSARQQLEEGGLSVLQSTIRGIRRYLVRNEETGGTHYTSSVHLQPNGDIHISVSSLRAQWFPNNHRLLEFIEECAEDRGQRYVLHEQHIPEMMRILRGS